MLQAQGPQFAGPPQEAIAAQLGKLRATANELKLRASDLAQRKSQLSEQRRLLGTNQSSAALDKQIADAQHDLVAAGIQLESVNEDIEELQTQRDMARAFSLQGPQPPQGPQTLQGPPGIATTAPPALFFDPQIARERERMIGIGAIIVLAPLALALSRRIWHRGGRAQAVDLENSPRLQRIEQAVEAIALEVERIGEAQRFTTKLLSERQPEVAQHLASQPRREPGTITPH
jgi:hypothetical protein